MHAANIYTSLKIYILFSILKLVHNERIRTASYEIKLITYNKYVYRITRLMCTLVNIWHKIYNSISFFMSFILTEIYRELSYRSIHSLNSLNM